MLEGEYKKGVVCCWGANYWYELPNRVSEGESIVYYYSSLTQFKSWGEFQNYFDNEHHDPRKHKVLR